MTIGRNKVGMKKAYEQLIQYHFVDHTQMALLTGPRQVVTAHR
jgi:hypothetical protein